MTKEQFAIEVGKKIRKHRKEVDISQEKLAHECGFYRTYVGHLENGRYSPTAYVLWKIAKALKIPVEKFYP
ncbi:MAG: helix-turn-helix domain-containing protein [Patescibacteria group bacterium]